jgi:tryptophanyl-tRNA synthetase
VQERYRELRQDASLLAAVLQQGRERATAVADATLSRVRDSLGFLPPAS